MPIDEIIERCTGGRGDGAMTIFDASYLISMTDQERLDHLPQQRQRYVFAVTKGVIRELCGKYKLSRKIEEEMLRGRSLSPSLPLRSYPPLYYLQQLGVRIYRPFVTSEQSGLITTLKDQGCTVTGDITKISEPMSPEDVEQVALGIGHERTVVFFTDDGHIARTVPQVNKQEGQRMAVNSHIRRYSLSLPSF